MVDKYILFAVPFERRAGDIMMWRKLGRKKAARCLAFMLALSLVFPGTVHVETCVLLGRESGRDTKYEYIDYEPKEDSWDKTKATYAEIKAWIEENYGLKVSSLYIGQVKDMCGLSKERESRNSRKYKNPQCPAEKVEAIKAAFEHFGMIH